MDNWQINTSSTCAEENEMVLHIEVTSPIQNKKEAGLKLMSGASQMVQFHVTSEQKKSDV